MDLPETLAYPREKQDSRHLQPARVELVQGGRVNATDGIPASAQEQAPAVLRVRLLEGRARVLQAGERESGRAHRVSTARLVRRLGSTHATAETGEA
jgi:hypothetical protein